MSGQVPKQPLLLKDAFVIDPNRGQYPYSPLQIFGYVITCFFPALSLVVCCLRIYSRTLAKGFGWDDWLIFIAMFLALPQAVFTIFVLKSGYWGIHDASVPRGIPINTGAFWIFINGIVYNPLLALVKVSALLFLLRLGKAKKHVRLACHFMIVFNILQLLTFLPVAIVQCLPIESPWVTVPNARCIRRDIYSITLAVFNILTDILTLLIPFFIFLGLKVSTRVRNALLAVFLLGSMVTIVSVVRLYYIIRLYYIPVGDRHYSIGYVSSTVEINLAIITASVPALWPLARRWFPAAFATLGINRPGLYPDIEVGYATNGKGSRASRTIRGKVTWKRERHVPSGVFVAGAGDVTGQKVRLGSGGSGRLREEFDRDGDDLTYHDMVRVESGGRSWDGDSIEREKEGLHHVSGHMPEVGR
ncbi:hypothetical protein OQA88_12068 [Cercophora sp. LCS_1]